MQQNKDSKKGFINKFDHYLKMAYLSLAIPILVNANAVQISKYINDKTESKETTAVFTRGYDMGKSKDITAKMIDFFMYAPITLKQNMKGRKVEWFSNANKEDIIEKLYDSNYKNFILIGHGSKSTYVANNGVLNAYELKYEHLPKRKGEFIAHTCGSGNGLSLRDVIFKNGSTGYEFNEDISGFHNYGKALVELFKKKE